MMVPVREFTVHACFHIKLLIFFWKCTFTRITRTEQELSFTITAPFPIYLNTSFVTITFCGLFFFREGLARPVNNKPPKKQINAEIQVALKKGPAQKRAEEKMFYTLSQQITKPNCKLTLLKSESVSINFTIWITSIIIVVILNHMFNSKVKKTMFPK